MNGTQDFRDRFFSPPPFHQSAGLHGQLAAWELNPPSPGYKPRSSDRLVAARSTPVESNHLIPAYQAGAVTVWLDVGGE